MVPISLSINNPPKEGDSRMLKKIFGLLTGAFIFILDCVEAGNLQKNNTDDPYDYNNTNSEYPETNPYSMLRHEDD